MKTLEIMQSFLMKKTIFIFLPDPFQLFCHGTGRFTVLFLKVQPKPGERLTTFSRPPAFCEQKCPTTKHPKTENRSNPLKSPAMLSKLPSQNRGNKNLPSSIMILPSQPRIRAAINKPAPFNKPSVTDKLGAMEFSSF